MNTTNYKQYDTRWAKLPYRYNPDNIGNNGCGEVSVCNSIIEMVSQMNQTPATMVDYCRQYACSDGTYHSGIPKMLEHYGCTEVMEHPNFASLWRELEKGNRIAIYLMDSTPAGSKGVHWTSGGHFVASVAYKCENGQHWVYMKDSNSISELRNGWITYEGNIRGACPKVWSGKLNGSPAPTPTPTPTGKLVVDGVGGYETVKRLQEFLKLSGPDGLIGRQRKSMVSKYVPSLTAVSYSMSGGSNTVTALQKWLGLSDPDGLWGKNTSGALQRRLRDYGYLAADESIDEIFGPKSMKALQTALNNDFKKKTDPPTPPTPTPTTDTKVIDVSSFQPSIDFAKVKADGVQGVIVKCGFRHGESGALDEDSDYMRYIKGAYDVGLPVGIYFFTEAVNAKEGKEEAQYTIKLWQKAGIPISYPIGIDSENVFWTNPDGSKGKGRANSDMLSKAKRTEAIKAFCEEIKAQGYTPMIYASLSWFDDCLDMSQLPYDVWCAQYYKECQYKGNVVMWQYTSDGKVNGIPKVVDLNHCYIEPKAVNPPQPTPSGGYTGAFPTEAEIRDAQVNAMCQACKDQTAWSYSSVYEFENNPTIPKSKYKSTCVTYVSCVLQRTGVYDSGDCLWCDGRGYGNGKVRGANGQMSVTYYNNKKSLKDLDLQTCDILVYDDNQSGEMGNGGHEEIFNGVRNANYSYFYSGGTGSYHNTTNNNRENNSRKVLAVVRIKWRTFIKMGDRGNAVLEWQDYLDWWSDGQFYRECGKGDGVFGANTDKWTKAFQTAVFGASEADGTVGQKTITAAKNVRK